MNSLGWGLAFGFILVGSLLGLIAKIWELKDRFSGHAQLRVDQKD